MAISVPAPMAMPDIGPRKSRCIVDAVSDHGNPAFFLQALADRLLPCHRAKRLRDHLDPHRLVFPHCPGGPCGYHLSASPHECPYPSVPGLALGLSSLRTSATAMIPSIFPSSAKKSGVFPSSERAAACSEKAAETAVLLLIKERLPPASLFPLQIFR